jgi:hypothetical protein
MPRRPLLHRAALATAVLAAALACQGGELSAPPDGAALAPATASRGGIGGSGSRHLDQAVGRPTEATPVSCKGRNVAVVSGRFGPGGGTLVFGESRLIIPGGALRDTVTITATTLDTSTSTVNFEPEGLRFYKPAGLVLSAAGCTLPEDGTPAIVYLADDGAVLETISAYYDPHWKAVAAPITHFSGYAIAFRGE